MIYPKIAVSAAGSGFYSRMEGNRHTIFPSNFANDAKFGICSHENGTCGNHHSRHNRHQVVTPEVRRVDEVGFHPRRRCHCWKIEEDFSQWLWNSHVEAVEQYLLQEA